MSQVRKIILIDEERCDGCGQCITACAEGALELVDGKARLVGEIYCDGIGACIGECPQDALTIVERDAEPFDETAVEHRQEQLAREEAQASKQPVQGCPAAALRSFQTQASPAETSEPGRPSQLGHWPIQLRLVPPNAPFLKDADLLVCADCVPFAVPDFHSRYLAGRAVVVACPKLDDISGYPAKLAEMFAQSRPKRITVLRMEVPCCGVLAEMVRHAWQKACPDVPFEIHTIGLQGGIGCQTVSDKRGVPEGAAP